jgi:hypothetical protein
MMRTVDQVDGHNAMANLAAVDEYNDTYFGSIKVLDAQRVLVLGPLEALHIGTVGLSRISGDGCFAKETLGLSRRAPFAAVYLSADLARRGHFASRTLYGGNVDDDCAAQAHAKGKVGRNTRGERVGVFQKKRHGVVHRV